MQPVSAVTLTHDWLLPERPLISFRTHPIADNMRDPFDANYIRLALTNMQLESIGLLAQKIVEQ